MLLFLLFLFILNKHIYKYPKILLIYFKYHLMLNILLFMSCYFDTLNFDRGFKKSRLPFLSKTSKPLAGVKPTVKQKLFLDEILSGLVVNYVTQFLSLYYFDSKPKYPILIQQSKNWLLA